MDHGFADSTRSSIAIRSVGVSDNVSIAVAFALGVALTVTRFHLLERRPRVSFGLTPLRGLRLFLILIAFMIFIRVSC